MKEEDVSSTLLEMESKISMLTTELLWLQDISIKQNVRPGTAMGDEILQKFFSLYRDYKKIKRQAIDLFIAVHDIEFKDRTLGMIYNTVAKRLVAKLNERLFEEFTSVAEHGCLPGDLSS